MKSRQSQLLLLILALTIGLGSTLLSGPASATKIGVIMNDHSGPEYYPSRPDGMQCAACGDAVGTPYTDGYDHSSDGYFAMKYFLAHLTNVSAHIPGFVVDAFALHGQGFILKDKDNPNAIVDDPDYFSGTPYTPTLIDAWGQEGIYVNPANVAGADPVTGYISYTNLYMNFNDTDGTPLYIWPQPLPYPSGDPDYPAIKEAYNAGGSPYYLLPRDVMNAYEDTNYDGGGNPIGVAGYGPAWTIPVGANYLEGPILEAASSAYYPDNGWQNMLAWEYWTNFAGFPECVDYFEGIVKTTTNAWNEHDFWEFVGFDTYASRKELGGGRAVYAEEVTGQMNMARDYVWDNYQDVLTGGEAGYDKHDLIKVTYSIDPCFCDGVDATNSIHGKSVYDGIYDLIVNQGVDYIIYHPHFIGHSKMMNDDMGWHMAMMAIMQANMTLGCGMTHLPAPGCGFNFQENLLFAPGHPMTHSAMPMEMHSPDSGTLPNDPFRDYYQQYYLGDRPLRELVLCRYAQTPIYSDPDAGSTASYHGLPEPNCFPDTDPYTVDKEEYVAGVALRDEYRAALVDKLNGELLWAKNEPGSQDIAVFYSAHGNRHDVSRCFDALNDHTHLAGKLFYIRGVEDLLADPTFKANFGNVVSKTYSPYPLTDAEAADLNDLSDGDDIAILQNTFHRCVITTDMGYRLALYRVQGQMGFDSEDPSGETSPPGMGISPRETLHDIVDSVNDPGDLNWNVTHVVDLIFNFMGQSSDVSDVHRYEGYGEMLECCNDDSLLCYDPAGDECVDQNYLYDLAKVFPDPNHSTTHFNAWWRFQTAPPAGYGIFPEQYCYPPEDASETYGTCWDFGHDNANPACNNDVPEGCYVSLFTVYDDPAGWKYTPGGLKVKITNGSWGWDAKVAGSRNYISEALMFYFDPATIRGLVKDGADAYPGLEMRLYKFAPCGGYSQVDSTLTDAEGKYAFTGLADGVYKVEPWQPAVNCTIDPLSAEGIAIPDYDHSPFDFIVSCGCGG